MQLPIKITIKVPYARQMRDLVFAQHLLIDTAADFAARIDELSPSADHLQRTYLLSSFPDNDIARFARHLRRTLRPEFTVECVSEPASHIQIVPTPI